MMGRRTKRTWGRQTVVSPHVLVRVKECDDVKAEDEIAMLYSLATRQE
jgi:hypothetical protein